MESGNGRKDKEMEERASKLWKEELEQSTKVLAKVIQAQPLEVRKELVKILTALLGGNPIPKNKSLN